IAYLEDATSSPDPADAPPPVATPNPAPTVPAGGLRHRFDPRRIASYARRETLELIRDPIRLTLALVGNALLMLVMGYGITLDVEDLSFAVLDHDQTTISRDYVLNLAGSRYFREQ